LTTEPLIIDRIRALVGRRVSAAEVREAVERPLSEAEREDVLALARWFLQRYPTGADRLRYVRRAYARWHTARPSALDP
jgi:hypothetical protein